MVLESLAATLLSKYLGDYLSGLQKENLKLSILSGQVTLENVELKREAVDALDLPVVVKEGFVGTVSLTVPWRNLGTQPAIIKLDRVFLLVVPKDPNQQEDESRYEKRQQDEKQKQLRNWESMKQARLEMEAASKDSKSGDTFTMKLVTKVVDNLQLEITNVHIRIEDNITDPEKPFVAGITIEKVSGQSTDHSWNPKWLENETIVHKLLSLKNLALYWNPSEPFLKFKNSSEAAEALQKLIKTGTQSPKHHYVLQPVSGELRVTMNKSDAPDMKNPKVTADLMLPELGVTLEELQYNNLANLLDIWSLYQRGIKYRKLRPKTELKKSPRQWWKFAANCIIEEIRHKQQQWTWDYMSVRTKSRKDYINLYRKTNVGIKMTPAETERLQELERNLTYDDIVFFRSIADAMMRRDQTYVEEQRKKKTSTTNTGWTSYFWTAKPAEMTSQDIEALPDTKMSNAEWEELYQMIGYNKSDTYVAPSQQPKEYVSVKAAFSLKRVVVKLMGAESAIAFATASDLYLAGMIRPTSTIFQASLGDVEVTDQHTKDTKFPKLLYRSPTTGKEEDNRLIVASYEMGPLDKPDDYYATLEIKPLEVIYQKRFIDRILAFIRNATPEAVENIEITIANKLRGLRETTQLQLLQALEAQKTFGASINIRAPTILFPEDCLSDSTSLFVVDLGRFQMESVHKKKQEEQKEFYEDYKIVMAQLKAFLAYNKDDWRSAEVQKVKKDKMSLIEGFDINLHLKQAKVDSEALTRVILEGSLPALELNLSPEKLGKILSIVYSSLGITGSASTPTQPSLPSDQNAAPTIDLSKEDLSKKEEDRNLLARLKLFEGNFAINQVTLVLKNESSDLAVVTASGFNIKLLKRTYDLKADVYLTSIAIEDKMQTFGDDFKYIANSGTKSTKLIEIHYFSIDRISPEYKNVDQEIDFKFSTLNINFNRDTVLTILNVVNQLTATVSGPTPATTTAPQTAVDSKQTTVVRKHKDITTLKLAANLEELSLSLNREGTRVALIAVTKVTAHLNMREDATMSVEGTLGNILLKDLTELGKHKYSTVLETISASEMMEFKYATYSIEDKLGYDSSISLKMNSIRFVYLNRFLDEILTYLNEAQQVKEVIDGVSSKAAEIAKDAVVESRQLMKMDFIITNPIILAPRHSTSDDVIEADLGKIVINNKFSYPQNELHSRNNITEVISLGITAMNLATGEFKDGSVSNKRQVLLDTGLTLQITRSLHSDNADMKIAAAIPNIGLSLSEPQIQSLLAVYTENMNEKGSFTSSVKPTEKSKAIAPTSAETPKPASTLELEFRLGKVTLQTFAYNPITKESTPMIGFSLNKFDVHLTQKSDSSMNANLGIATILISDIREQSSANKHIFSQEDSNASLISVDYFRTPEGNQIIKAHFDRPQLTVIPETVMPLKDFFMRVLGDVQKSLAAVSTSNTTEVTSPSKVVAKVDPLVYTKVSVDLNEICVKLIDRSDVLSILYARGLGFNMNQRQYDMALEATLTSLVLEDCVQPFGAEFKYLIDTSSVQQGEFIKVEYKSAQQLSPDYDNVEQLINLEFKNLNINMNRETVVKLIDFSTRFSSPVEQTPGQVTDQQVAPVDTTVKSTETEVKDSSITTLKLKAKIDSLGATLNKNGTKLANISITKVATEYVSRKDNTMIANGSLGNVAIRDLTEEGRKYPDILDIVSSDSKFIEFSYETFTSSHPVDNAVKLKMSSVRFIFLNRFISGVQLYINEVNQMKEMIAGMSNKAAAMAKDAVDQIVEPKSLFKFDILVEEPIILIPKSSTSEEVVEANLGRISIENKFEVKGENRQSGEISESIHLGIKDIHLACGKYIEKNVMQGSSTILQRTDMQLAIGRSLNPPTSEIKVDLKVPRVGVLLREDQLELLIGIYSMNLNEGVVPPTSETTSSAVQPAPTPTQETVATKFDVYFSLQEVAFEIYGYDSQNNIVPTVALYLDNLESNIKQFADSSMKADLTTSSVKIVDIRPTTKVQYKEIFAPAPAANLVHILFERDPKGNQKISFSFDRPVVSIYPDAVMSLKDFGIRFSDKVQKLLAENTTTAVENKPHSSASPAPTATQTVILLELNEIALSLLDGETDVRTVVVLYGRGLSLIMNQQDKSMKATVKLTSLQLEDRIQPYGTEFQYLLDTRTTDEASEFVKIDYSTVQSEEEDYKTSDQAISVLFNTLAFNVNRETLITLLEISKKFSSPAAPSTTNVTPSTPGPQSDKPTLSSLKVNAILGLLVVNLNKNGQKLARIKLNKTRTNVFMKPDETMTVQGQLGNLSVQDLTEKGKRYPVILDVVGNPDKMAEFNYETLKDEDNVGFSIQLIMNSVQFVYLNRFVEELQGYLYEVQQMKELTDSVSAAAADKTKQAVDSLVEKKLMKYEIVIKNPIVMVPRNSNSEEVIQADLGKIYLKNQLQLDPLHRSEVIQLQISSVNLTTGRHIASNNSMMISDTILQRTDITMAITRPLNPEDKHLDLNIDIPKVGVVLKESQIELLLGIVKQNMTEKASLAIQQVQQENAVVPPLDLKSIEQKPQSTESSAMELDVNLKLSQISLEIHGWDNLETKKRTLPVIGIYLTTLEGSMKQKSDSSLKVIMMMSSMSITDLRIDTPSTIKSIITPTNTGKNLVAVQYLKNNKGDQDIIVDIDKISASVVPSTLMYMKDFSGRLSASMNKFSSASTTSSSTSSNSAALLLSPRARTSSRTPTASPRPVTKTQSESSMQVKANLNEISLKLTDMVEPNKYKDLIVINGTGLGVSLVQNPNDVKAVVKLTGLQVEDRFQQFGPSFQYLMLTNISTNTDISEFVKVEYYSAHKENSNQQYQDIDILFNVLHVNMNRETLIQLLESSKKFTSSAAAPVATEEPTETEATPASTAASMKVNANLGQFSVNLNKQGRNLCNISLSKSFTTVSMRENGTMYVAGHLGNLSIEDLSEQGQQKYSKVLEIVGDQEKMVEFSYTTHTPQDNMGYDFAVQLKTNSLRFIYLTRFIKGIQSYIYEVKQMKELVDSVSSAAAEKTKQAVDTLVEPKTLMKLDIVVASPIIILPKNSYSPDIVSADLGNIKLTNVFENKHENLSLSIASLNLGYGSYSDNQITITQRILDHTDIQLDVTRSVMDSSSLKISALIPKIRIEVAEPQIDFMLAVYSENMSEAASNYQEEQTKSDDKSAVVEAPKPAKSAITIDLMLTLSEASFELYGYNNNALYPVVGFYMDNFIINYLQSNDNSMKALIRIRSISVKDIRKDVQNRYPEIFSPSLDGSTVGKNIVAIQYGTSVEGNQHIIIDIERPVITIVPQVVMEINQFTMKLLEAVQKKMANTFPPSTPAKPVVSSKTEQKMTQMSIQLSMSEPSIRTIERMESIITQALVIKTPLIEVGYTASKIGTETVEQQISFVLKKLSTFKYTLPKKSSNVSIIEPFSMSVVVRIQPTMMDAFIHLDHIHLIFSYRDFKLIMNILNGFNALNKQEPINLSASTSMDEPEEAPVAAQPPTVQKQENFKFSKTQVRLTVLNDYESLNTPVVDLYLDDVFASAANWSSEKNTEYMITSELLANYFNSQIQRWEPLIEPWEFSIKINKKDEVLQKGYAIEFSSSTRLDLNITTDFMDILLRSMNAWNEDYYNTETKKSPITRARSVSGAALAAHPYYIRNSTGQNLFYWTVVGSNISPKLELKSGEECPLVTTDITTSRDRKADLDQTMNKLSDKNLLSFCVADNPTIVKGLSIDDVGIKSFDVDAQKVIYEVVYNAGCKVIDISSAVSVFNDTDTTVLVQMKSKEKQQVLPLSPRKKSYIPIQYTSDGLIAIKPDKDQFTYCTPLDCKSLHTMTTAPQKLQCSNTQPNSRPYLFNLQVEEFKNGDSKKIAKNVQRFSLTLRAPIQVENLLATSLTFQLMDSHTTQLLHASTVEKGAHMLCHELNSTQQLAFTVQVPGFKSSSPLLIYGENPPTYTEILDDRGRPLHIKIDNTIDRKTGVRSIALYVKYWIYNRTGMRVLYGYNNGKQTAAGQTQYETDKNELWTKLPIDTAKWYLPEYKNTPVFMFSYPSKVDHKCFIKIANSEWSKDGLNFDTSGMLGYVELLDSHQKGQPTKKFELGVKVDQVPDKKFWRTKMVTFTPRFMIVNNMTSAIVCKQKDATDINWVAQDAQIPFHWADESKPQQMLMSFQQNGWTWSGAFSVESPVTLALKLKNTFQEKNVYFPQVQVIIDGATTFIVFSNENKDHPPYIIHNKTNNILTVSQKDVKGASDVIWPNSRFIYTWDEPTKPHLLLLKIQGKNEAEYYKVDKIKKYKPSKIGNFRAETKAEGPTRVFEIADVRRSNDNKKRKNRELEVTDTKIVFQLSGFGLSLIDSKPQEIMYFSMDGINIEYDHSNVDTDLEVKMKSIQIDNQIPWTPFPIVFCPTTSDNDIFFHFSIVKYNKYTTIDYYKYFSILLQECDINIDEEFLVRSLNVLSDSLKVIKTTQADTIPLEPEFSKYTDKASTQGSKMVYFELFHLNPVKANVSYVSVSGIEEQYETSARKLLGVTTKILTNVDRAPLTLNLLLLKHPFTTQEDLINRILSHYKRQGLQQVYKILGSFEMLGSPLTLINNLGTGVYDFFHEPAKGITKSPKDFGLGLAKGTKSLISATVYGIFNTVTHITETLNKGMGKLSLDAEYERERQQREQPKHVGEGLLFGVRDLGLGLFKGVTGLVEEPVKGAKHEGVEGFFKGLGRGVIGVGARPVRGVIDLATQTTKGIRNTTSLFDNKITSRKRPPRYIGPENIIEPYSYYKSEGAQYLANISGGKYKAEVYVHHWVIPDSPQRAVLLSKTRLFVIKKDDLKIIWKEKLHNIKPEIKETSEGLMFYTKQGEPTTRVLRVVDKQLASQLKKELENILSK